MIKNKLKNSSYTFLGMNVYLILLITIPKNFSTIFNIIPIRPMLSILLFCIFLYDLYRKKIELNKINIKPFTYLYITFLISTIPSIVISKSLIVSLYTIVKFITFYLILIIFIKTKLTKENYKTLLHTALFTTLLVIIYGILQYIFEFNLNLNGTEKYNGIRGRIPSTFFNPIYFGSFLNIVFLPILFFTKEKTINNKLGVFLLTLLFIALTLTFTRSAILIFCGILFLSAIFLRKLTFSKITIFVVAICIVISLIIPGAKQVTINSFANGIKLIINDDFRSSFLLDFFDNKDDNDDNDKGDNDDIIDVEEDASIISRKEFTKIANKISKDHPFTGVGLGAYIEYMNSEDFDINYSDYKFSKTNPHGGFVLLAAETGYISITLFIISQLSLMYIFIKKWFISIKEKSRLNYSLVTISIITFVGFMITCMISENLFYDTQIYSLLIIFISLMLNASYSNLQVEN